MSNTLKGCAVQSLLIERKKALLKGGITEYIFLSTLRLMLQDQAS